MTEINNTKVTANVTTTSDSSQVEYVTFWGKLKGDIEKQTDLADALKLIKRSINELSTKYLRKQDKLTPGYNITIEKDSEDRTVISGPVKTSDLYNDGDGGSSSEGIVDEFVVRSFVADRLSEVYDDLDATEETINEKIDGLEDSKQNVLTAGHGIDISNESVISVLTDTVPHNGVLTINHNGVSQGTFSANQEEDTTIELTTSILPNVTASDNGKVLGVKNGKWDIITNIIDNVKPVGVIRISNNSSMTIDQSYRWVHDTVSITSNDRVIDYDNSIDYPVEDVLDIFVVSNGQNSSVMYNCNWLPGSSTADIFGLKIDDSESDTCGYNIYALCYTDRGTEIL